MGVVLLLVRRRKLNCANFNAKTNDLLCPWLPSRFMG